MEADLKTLLCTKCNKHIIAFNFKLHQLKCTAIPKKSRIFNKQNSNNQPTQSLHKNNNNQKINHTNYLQKDASSSNQLYYDYSKNYDPITSEKIQQKHPIETKLSFSRHPKAIKIFPKQESTHNCIRCGEKVKISEIENHIELCVSIDQKCEYCNQCFPKTILQEHVGVCEARKYLQQIQRQSQNQYYQEMGDEMFHSFEESQQQEQFNFSQRLGALGQSIRALYQEMLNNFQISSSEGLNKNQLNKLNKIKYQRKEGDIDQCSICFVEFQHKQCINQLNCRHLYHSSCISQWLQINSLCPVCKRDVRTTQAQQK